GNGKSGVDNAYENAKSNNGNVENNGAIDSAIAKGGASKPYVEPIDMVGATIRPQTFADYFGQPRAVLAVQDSIKSAKLRGAALQHVLIYGAHGLGKTTFARIIASEMGVDFVEINVSKLTPKELINVLSKLKDRDIVFIDEIHNIPQETAESVLYSAMEDFQVCYVEMNGKESNTIKMKLPHFTLVGATTEAGKLSKPLIARAQIQCRLEPYSDEVLAQIAQKSFGKLGMSIDENVALEIAKRCRHNPRIVNRHVSRIADKATCNYAEQSGIVASGSLNTLDAIKNLNIVVDQNVALEYFEQNGIDNLGLEEGDRSLLLILINNFDGGPTSIDTLARAMGESVNVVFDKYEDYLIKMGMIKITTLGRVATKRAYDHLGIKYNKRIDDIVDNDKNCDDKKDEKIESEILPSQDSESEDIAKIDDESIVKDDKPVDDKGNDGESIDDKTEDAGAEDGGNN
ncbi:MAG: Holliday junction branch migration DNA helicase RuvB, partial [Clostridia bacterium]